MTTIRLLWNTPCGVSVPHEFGTQFNSMRNVMTPPRREGFEFQILGGGKGQLMVKLEC